MSNCEYWPECKITGHCECEAAAESADRPWLLRSRYRFIAVSASLLVLIYVVGMVAFAVAARAHEAASGMFVYLPLCCNSARTSPTGDCDAISSTAVIARSDGEHRYCFFAPPPGV